MAQREAPVKSRRFLQETADDPAPLVGTLQGKAMAGSFEGVDSCARVGGLQGIPRFPRGDGVLAPFEKEHFAGTLAGRQALTIEINGYPVLAQELLSRKAVDGGKVVATPKLSSLADRLHQFADQKTQEATKDGHRHVAYSGQPLLVSLRPFRIGRSRRREHHPRRPLGKTAQEGLGDHSTEGAPDERGALDSFVVQNPGETGKYLIETAHDRVIDHHETKLIGEVTEKREVRDTASDGAGKKQRPVGTRSGNVILPIDGSESKCSVKVLVAVYGHTTLRKRRFPTLTTALPLISSSRSSETRSPSTDTAP